MIKEFEDLQNSVDFIQAEIDRFEREFDFLFDETGRFCDIDIAEKTKLFMESNPDAIEFIKSNLGEEFLDQTQKKIEELPDEIPIDKEKLVTSFNWVLNVLINLHRKLNNYYSEMIAFVEKCQFHEHLDEAYEKKRYREVVGNSIKSHQEMINFYQRMKSDYVKSFSKIKPLSNET